MLLHCALVFCLFGAVFANTPCSFPLYGSGVCTITPQGSTWTITNEDSGLSVEVEVREHDGTDVLLDYTLHGNWTFEPADSEAQGHDYVIFDIYSVTARGGHLFTNLLLSTLLCLFCLAMGQKRMWPLVLVVCILAVFPVAHLADTPTVSLVIYVPRGQPLDLNLQPSSAFNVVVGCVGCVTTSSSFTCASGFYTSSGKCAACAGIANCKEDPICVSGTTSKCFDCEDGFYKDVSGTADSCKACDPLCSICVGPGLSQCRRCNSGYHLVNGTTCVACKDACPAGTFESEACTSYSDRLCTPCFAGCASCHGHLNEDCDSCVTGFYFEKDACPACPSTCTSCTSATSCQGCKPGYYLNGGVCTACDSACTTCSAAGTGSCGGCTKGFYLAGTTCAPCNSKCPTCTGALITECTSCVNGTYLSGTECKDEAALLCTFSTELPELSSAVEYSWNCPATMADVCSPTAFIGVFCDAAKTTVVAIDIDAQVVTVDITGNIPAGVALLPNLGSIKIVRTSITGTVPSQLATMPKLTSVNLIQNDLDTLPTEIGNSKTLKSLLLSRNAITGTLPTTLGKLTTLTTLDLAENLITSTIPTEYGNAASLTLLELNGVGNTITGPIPAQFTRPITIQSGPGLCGAIPAAVTLKDADGAQVTSLPACVP